MIQLQEPLDEIFVEKFSKGEYRKIAKQKKDFDEGKKPRKKIDIAMDFFRKDKDLNTITSWNLFCNQIGFSYSTFLKAYHKVQEEGIR